MASFMENKAVCPECEIKKTLSGITKDSLLKEVLALPFVEGVTASREIFENRLSVCSLCPSLKDEILCSECGSYVMYRARILNNRCPFPGRDLWK